MNVRKWHHSEIRIAINDESQGSAATRLGCGGIFNVPCYKFPAESYSERILKIGQYLVKLWARVCVLFF